MPRRRASSNADALAAALKAGYRLSRVDAKHKAPDAVDTIKVPAQTLHTAKEKK
jgi:hypothetical protein